MKKADVRKNRRGEGLVGYLVVLVLVVLVAMSAVKPLGETIKNAFTKSDNYIKTDLESQIPGGSGGGAPTP